MWLSARTWFYLLFVPSKRIIPQTERRKIKKREKKKNQSVKAPNFTQKLSMVVLSVGLATIIPVARSNSWRPIRSMPTKISCIGWVQFLICVCEISNLIILYSFKFLECYFLFLRRKDPEGILGPPQTGHIARQEFKRRLQKDAELREEFERQVREEKERRQALRNVIWI